MSGTQTDAIGLVLAASRSAAEMICQRPCSAAWGWLDASAGIVLDPILQDGWSMWATCLLAWYLVRAATLGGATDLF